MTTKLISASDFNPYKTLSINVNAVKKVDPFILEAQEFDLKNLMGDSFYYDLIKDFNNSPSLSKYYDLFNGSTYICDGNEIYQSGIKAVLIYLSYSRYVAVSNIEATAFGTVHKKEEFSEPVSESTIKRLKDQAYSGALEYWQGVEKFIKSNFNDYPLFKGCHLKNKTSIKISGVSHNTRWHR